MRNPLEGCDILLVENEFLISVHISQILEAAGASVTRASRLSDSFAALDRQFCAAVLDVRLPDGEVYPVADVLKERNVPIVFHSGHAEVDVLANQYPEAAYLEKPANEKKLLVTIVAQADKGRSQQ